MDEHFKLNVWEQCFLECGIDTNAIAHREYSLDEKPPWEHLDSGVTDNYLKREYERAQKGITTKDCRKGCHGCFDLISKLMRIVEGLETDNEVHFAP